MAQTNTETTEEHTPQIVVHEARSPTNATPMRIIDVELTARVLVRCWCEMTEVQRQRAGRTSPPFYSLVYILDDLVMHRKGYRIERCRESDLHTVAGALFADREAIEAELIAYRARVMIAPRGRRIGQLKSVTRPRSLEDQLRDELTRLREEHEKFATEARADLQSKVARINDLEKVISQLRAENEGLIRATRPADAAAIAAAMTSRPQNTPRAAAGTPQTPYLPADWVRHRAAALTQLPEFASAGLQSRTRFVELLHAGLHAISPSSTMGRTNDLIAEWVNVREMDVSSLNGRDGQSFWQRNGYLSEAYAVMRAATVPVPGAPGVTASQEVPPGLAEVITQISRAFSGQAITPALVTQIADYARTALEAANMRGVIEVAMAPNGRDLEMNYRAPEVREEPADPFVPVGLTLPSIPASSPSASPTTSGGRPPNSNPTAPEASSASTTDRGGFLRQMGDALAAMAPILRNPMGARVASTPIGAPVPAIVGADREMGVEPARSPAPDHRIIFSRAIYPLPHDRTAFCAEIGYTPTSELYTIRTYVEMACARMEQMLERVRQEIVETAEAETAWVVSREEIRLKVTGPYRYDEDVSTRRVRFSVEINAPTYIAHHPGAEPMPPWSARDFFSSQVDAFGHLFGEEDNAPEPIPTGLQWLTLDGDIDRESDTPGETTPNRTLMRRHLVWADGQLVNRIPPMGSRIDEERALGRRASSSVAPQSISLEEVEASWTPMRSVEGWSSQWWAPGGVPSIGQMTRQLQEWGQPLPPIGEVSEVERVFDRYIAETHGQRADRVRDLMRDYAERAEDVLAGTPAHDQPEEREAVNVADRWERRLRFSSTMRRLQFQEGSIVSALVIFDRSSTMPGDRVRLLRELIDRSEPFVPGAEIDILVGLLDPRVTASQPMTYAVDIVDDRVIELFEVQGVVRTRVAALPITTNDTSYAFMRADGEVIVTLERVVHGTVVGASSIFCTDETSAVTISTRLRSGGTAENAAFLDIARRYSVTLVEHEGTPAVTLRLLYSNGSSGGVLDQVRIVDPQSDTVHRFGTRTDEGYPHYVEVRPYGASARARVYFPHGGESDGRAGYPIEMRRVQESGFGPVVTVGGGGAGGGFAGGTSFGGGGLQAGGMAYSDQATGRMSARAPNMHALPRVGQRMQLFVGGAPARMGEVRTVGLGDGTVEIDVEIEPLPAIEATIQLDPEAQAELQALFEETDDRAEHIAADPGVLDGGSDGQDD